MNDQAGMDGVYYLCHACDVPTRKDEVDMITQAVFDLARSVVENGDIDGLQAMLNKHPELPTAQNHTGKGTEIQATLLHYATCMPGMNPPPNAAEVVDILIAAGAEVDARSAPVNLKYAGETPLHWAASVNRGDLVERLVAAGADIEAAGGVLLNGSPLLLSALFGKQESAETLLGLGARYNILIAASVGRLDLVKAFFDENGNVCPGAYSLPCWGSHDESPQVALDDSFWNACCRGRLEVAQFLHERGANPGQAGPTGTTPMEEARENGHSGVVKWLGQIG